MSLQIVKPLFRDAFQRIDTSAKTVRKRIGSYGRKFSKNLKNLGWNGPVPSIQNSGQTTVPALQRVFCGLLFQYFAFCWLARV